MADVKEIKHKRKNHNGYIEIYMPDHHRARGNGYVFKHIVIAEKMINRNIKPNEVVHHINEIKTDNRTSNLKVMDRGEHTKLHSKDRKTGRYLKCEHCGSEFYRKPSHVKTARFCSLECNGNASNIKHVNNKYLTKERIEKALKNRSE